MKKAGTPPKKRPDRRVVWDEANLDNNEANKSAQMKIEEVPTPYNPCTDVQVSDDEDCKFAATNYVEHDNQTRSTDH